LLAAVEVARTVQGHVLLEAVPECPKKSEEEMPMRTQEAMIALVEEPALFEVAPATTPVGAVS
jgi:hypothetical protein